MSRRRESKIVNVSDFWSMILSVTWNQTKSDADWSLRWYWTWNEIGWIGNTTQMRQRDSSSSLLYFWKTKIKLSHMNIHLQNKLVLSIFTFNLRYNNQTHRVC